MQSKVTSTCKLFWLIADMRSFACASGMALVKRGRLSVQRVEQAAWDAIQIMADKGGWSDGQAKKTRSRKKQAPDDKLEGGEESPSNGPVRASGNPRKRKARQLEGGDDSAPVRRSARMRTKVDSSL